MKNLRFKVISKYLRPYKKEFLYGALALLVVNILSVVIPLEVKNIIDQLQGDNNFKRLRLGIGHPGKGKDVIAYVLKKAPKKDRSQLEKTFNNCISIGELIMTKGWEKTIMHFHTGKGASIES